MNNWDFLVNDSMYILPVAGVVLGWTLRSVVKKPTHHKYSAKRKVQ